MTIDEKDFDMYIWGSKPVDAPAAAPVADLEKLATEAWTPAWDQTPAPAITPAPEVTPPTDPVTPPAWEEAPAPEVTPPEWEVPATVETPAVAWDDVTWDELQKMLDTLNTEASTETIKKVEDATEAVQKASDEGDAAALKKANEILQTEVAELKANDIKNKKTIEVIKQEFEKTLNDKISLEFWTANDSKIAQLVNENPDVKNLISALLASWDKSKDKLDQARRSWFENATWISIDNIITAKKTAETSALWATEDAWTTTSKPGESMYIT